MPLLYTFHFYLFGLIAIASSLAFVTRRSPVAAAIRAPVVPVAHNAGEFWRRNAFIKQPGEVVVSIGPAIDTTGLSFAQQVDRIVALARERGGVDRGEEIP